MATKRKNKGRKRKKKTSVKIPSTLIVGGIFFVLILLIILAVINIKVKGLKSDLAQQEHVNKYISRLNIEIKAILFDLEIDKTYLRKKISKSDNKPTLQYELNLDKNEAERFFYHLNSLLKKENLKITYFDENKLIAKNNYLELIFNIKNINHKQVKRENVDLNHLNAKKLSIIIDDCGNNLKLAEKLAELNYPITMAVIPFQKYSKETALLAKKYGKTVFLHLPMQPKSYPNTDPGKGAIFLNTPKSLIEMIIKKDIETLGTLDGANNHMGSALTESREKMIQVLKTLKQYTNIFVDSHTSKNSVAYNVCKSLKMKCGINRKFIDNIDNEHYITNKLYEALTLFKKYNNVIIIGHLKENTVKVLQKELPKINNKGIKIAKINEVLD